MSRQAYQVSEMTKQGDIVHTHPTWAHDNYDAICLYETETGRWVDYKRAPEAYGLGDLEAELKNGNLLVVTQIERS